MNEHSIALSTLAPHGKIETKLDGKALDVQTTQALTSVAFNLEGDGYKRHCVSLPGKSRMPSSA